MSILDSILGAVHGLPLIGDEVNRLAINHIATRTVARPRPFSLWSSVPKPANGEGPVSDYTSWPGLTDKTFSARHLPPADLAFNANQPALGDVAALFARGTSMQTDRSSMLFMFFAQWFTDSVLRFDGTDRRKNTSNHEIDLCQIYGLTEKTATVLRSKNGGKLHCQTINGETYPAYLFDTQSLTVKPEFKDLPHLPQLLLLIGDDPAAKRKAYATGLERGNSSFGYAAISTLFLREHNRICDELFQRNPGWDDERLFQTARMINTVLLLKMVVEDYINHIAGHRLFKLDTSFAEQQNWYRANWIAAEFDLLYRWHGLIPDSIQVNGQTVQATTFNNSNALLEQAGLAGVLTAASSQKAGKIGLFNSPAFMAGAEKAALKMSRDLRLRSYNEYRVQFGLDALTNYGDLTSNAPTQQRLQALYPNIDQLEFLVGLFAEEPAAGSLFGSLLNVMVSYDAFTQIFTNPLLSQNIYNAQTFRQYGLDLIESTTSILDIAKRNVPRAEGLKVTLDA